MTTVQPGMTFDGVVSHLAEFGAFVDIDVDGDTISGLVHVTEIGDGVDNPYAELVDDEPVTVKVLRVRDDGKIDLSIKQADPDYDPEGAAPITRRGGDDRDFTRKLRRFMHTSQSYQGEVRRQQARRVDPTAYARQQRIRREQQRQRR